MTKSERDQYYASVEWAEIREAVMERADYRCERCKRPAEYVRHLTFENFGNASIDELQAVCKYCHNFLRGKGEDVLIKDVKTLRDENLRLYQALVAAILEVRNFEGHLSDTQFERAMNQFGKVAFKHSTVQEAYSCADEWQSQDSQVTASPTAATPPPADSASPPQ